MRAGVDIHVAGAGGNGHKFSGSGMKKTVPRRALDGRQSRQCIVFQQLISVKSLPAQTFHQFSTAVSMALLHQILFKSGERKRKKKISSEHTHLLLTDGTV